MSPIALEAGRGTQDWQGRVQTRVGALLAAGFHTRLLARDDSLWGADAERRKVAKTRLGWLESPQSMRDRAPDFTAFADEVRRDGFTRVLLLGMGGSSLAPETLVHIFGTRPGGLPLTVLDDTSPGCVRWAEGLADPARTLVLVSSKSGGTIEVSSFEQAFWARAQAVLGSDTGRSFVAITDPGTPLAARAVAKRYRRVFENPPDIGGRYSALSCFGLVPAALLGIDPAELCRQALVERDAFARDGGDALRLGAALGELALAGRDKMTLVLPPALEPLGAWIEQLVAESTGKDGRGILPVDGEHLGEPAVYGNDRVFVTAGVGEMPPATARALEALAAAGQPVIRWQRAGRSEDGDEVGAAFLRWEIATAVAGAILDVDPFDEPNVAEAKAATRRVLDRRAAAAAPAARERDGSLLLYAPEGSAVGGGDVRAWAASFLRQLTPGDYAAVLAYLHRARPRRALLDRLRHAIRNGSRAATTLGYGPRYLHSTGQFHKGGPQTGVFLMITTDEDRDEPIPGEAYGFAALWAAQAAGDYEVLAAHGLRVARVHVSGDPEAGIARLASTFEAAATKTP